MGESSSLSTLYLHSPADRPPLRVGLLMDSYTLPASIAAILDDVAACNFAHVELVVMNTPAAVSPSGPAARKPLPLRAIDLLRDKRRREGLLFHLYSQWDRKRHLQGNDPLAPVDCSERLRDTPVIRVQPLVKGFTHRFPPEALEEIRRHEIDVFFRFGFNILRGDVLKAARYGVWSYHHGDNDFYRGGPALFWEVYEDSPTSGVILQVLNEELDAGQVLMKGIYGTERGMSLVRNRHQPYWAASSFAIQKLNELHKYGWDAVLARAVPNQPYRGGRKIYRRPTNWEVAKFVGRGTLRKLVRRVQWSTTMGHWKIAVRQGRNILSSTSPTPDLEGFRWIESPRGHFYADPFLIKHASKRWVFLEDYHYGKRSGTLACGELTPRGELVDVRPILELPYHLSYPMVFEDGGQFWMIPESYAGGAIELYRASDFPYGWQRERVLYPAPAVDTTVWKQDGLFWFFTTFLEPNGLGARLMLFYAESLNDEWIPHPANPISSDVRNARCAGAIFREGHRLFRPSQDCSVRYGYSLALNEIQELNTETYAEQPAVVVKPWLPGLDATHSYARAGSVEMIDGNFREPKGGHL
jgi:hypothetical protein